MVRLAQCTHPLAIAMWDFSWLERRWAGAGYEDWNRALAELTDRGYEAVRIDAYPHLLAAGAGTRWRLLPLWTEHEWGAPGPLTISGLGQSLVEFITLCRQHGVQVALSSWYRQDTTDARMRLRTPQAQADAWIAVLNVIHGAGLSDQIIYVDLANEFPLALYNPYLYPEGSRAVPAASSLRRWMTTALTHVRAAYPDLDYCYSVIPGTTSLDQQDVTEFDLLELHIWMTESHVSDFYQRIGFDLPASSTDPRAYSQLQQASAEYRREPGNWQNRLRAAISQAAALSGKTGKPLATTEGWACITYKDWPGLDWAWVKELCQYAVDNAAATGRWALLATSNFTGPQFRGIWEDIAWHQHATRTIRSGKLPS